MKSFLAHVLAFLFPLLAAAQIPNTLLHSIPAPPVGAQNGAQLGHSVAVDGGYIVVGAPRDDLLGQDAGVVKVFDTNTGALLHVIANPRAVVSDSFGRSVAISGTRVAVGTSSSDSGAYVFDLSSGTPTIPVAILNSPNLSGGDYLGVSVAISGTRVVVGAIHEDTGAESAGSAYVYDLASGTPTVPVVTLHNPSPAPGDFFGYSVAISGTRVVVGTEYDDTGEHNSGSAYVYDLSSAIPAVPVVTLNNPSPAASGEFGGSVAISGTRVVVGARGDGSGSAYVYDLSSGTPAVPIVALINPAPQATVWFGNSASISGTRVVVGARGYGSAGPGAGSAYVYDLSSAMPAGPVAMLHSPSAHIDYGFSVAISATQVVVGAPSDDIGAADAGSAYVYDLSSGTPTAAVHTLNDPGPAAGDGFGASVAISGTRMVVSAPYDDTGGEDAGKVYVYDLASATPTVPAATLTSPDPQSNGGFGHSVAISGTRVIVGARAESYSVVGDWVTRYYFGAGRVHVFDLASPTPTMPVATINNPGPAVGDNFGCSVAISGTQVVVGAYGDDTGEEDAGSAYVYDLGSGMPTVPVHTLNNPSPAVGDLFGYSLAISGTGVVVGAVSDDTGADTAGSAYVYDLASGTPTVPVHTLNNPSPATFDGFGASVAISGPRVVVGANGDDTGASDTGSAYVYDLASGTPTAPAHTLNNPAPAAGDWFGSSVAISGIRVVVGASNDATIARSVGSGYVYDLASSTPTVPVATLNNPSPTMSDGFGSSAAIDGVSIIIGVSGDDSPQANKGSAYIFGPHPLDQDSDGLRDSWELLYWPSTTGYGPLDDHDHDGYEELLELAFGLNPTVGNPGNLPPVTEEGGYMTMTITKQPGVTYQVQTAGTLLPAQADSFSAASTTILINNATTLKVRDNFPASSSARRFIRAQVTAAP